MHQLPYVRVAAFESAEWPTTGQATQIPNDDGHFKYHPDRAGLLGRDDKTIGLQFTHTQRDNAMAAAQSAENPDDWLQYFWKASGARH